MGALIFIEKIRPTNGADFTKRGRYRVLVNGTLFVLLFLAFLFALFTTPGYSRMEDRLVVAVPYKYFFNLVDLWWIGAIFLIGVLLVLFGVLGTALKPRFRHGFWWTGIGVVLAVTSLFCISGYNNTAFLPSTTHPESSLFLANASSSRFTLQVMTWVTALLPIVIGYIAYVWYKMTSPAITTEELEKEDHIY